MMINITCNWRYSHKVCGLFPQMLISNNFSTPEEFQPSVSWASSSQTRVAGFTHPDTDCGTLGDESWTSCFSCVQHFQELTNITSSARLSLSLWLIYIFKKGITLIVSFIFLVINQWIKVSKEINSFQDGDLLLSLVLQGTTGNAICKTSCILEK